MMFRSSLEAYPDYVNAIGMITVEVGNMELALAQMLAKLLGVGPDVAGAIYFTPRGAIPRVEMMINVADIALARDRYNLSQTKNLLLRAKTVMGKRHKFVHDTWSLSEDGTAVHVSANPMTKKPGSAPVQLKQLTSLIEDTRKLITDLLALTMALPAAKLPPYPGIHVGPTPPGAR